jgi:predicted aspartyl protease
MAESAVVRNARRLPLPRPNWRSFAVDSTVMTGTVHSGEAIIPVRLRGPRGAINSIRTVLDTGFNDWLTLSPSEVAMLGLTFREEGHYILADGTETVSRLFEAEIEWFGILVVEMDGGPLLGMAILAGCRLTLEAVEHGRVEIAPLL